MVIRKRGLIYRVESKEGKNLGEYKTKKEAQKRIRQVEYFKHNKA